MYHRQNQNDH